MNVMEETEGQFDTEDIFIGNRMPKKALLGNRNLKKVRIPERIQEIGDWAFAHCKNLEEIWMPKGICRIGKEVFLGCGNLSGIMVYDVDKIPYEEEATLLAEAVKHFFWDGILDFSDLGSFTWYQIYDRHLLEYLNLADDEDFDPFLAGGEEDYEDPRNNRELFCEIKKQEKSNVCMERLYFGKYISEETKQELLCYLRKQEKSLLKVLVKKKEQACSYLKVCGNTGILTEDNIDAFLNAFVGAAVTESKAYLLQYKTRYFDRTQITGIWEDFQL